MPRGKRTKAKQKSSVDIEVVILIVLSIILAILIFSNSGYIGEKLSPFLGGLIGWIKYVLPFGTFAIAIYVAYDNDKEFITKKLLKYLIFVICLSTVISIYQMPMDGTKISGEFKEMVKTAFQNGKENIGGGAAGMTLAYPIVNLIGKTASIILFIGVAIISSIYIFGIKPAEMIKNYIENKKEAKELRRELKEEKSEIHEDKKSKKKELIKEEKVQKLPEINEEQIKIKMSDEPSPLFKKEEQAEIDKSKQVLTLEHTLTVEDENYEFPPINLLNPGKAGTKSTKKAITDMANKLQKTLYSFGVSAKVENASVGPTITRYELKPAEGVRVSKIANLAEDIALNLAAETIRIEAPIPGKQAVGIEIPNKEKEMVALRDIIDSEEFYKAKSKVSFALGKDASGEIIVTDIAKMPHVLIAGSTGSGKSVCINTLITSIIYKAKPSEVKLLMVDPKVVELSVYNGIPHLLIPVVTDPKKAAGALAWAVQEMVNRYNLFAEKKVRNIEGYNEALEKEGSEGKLPQRLCRQQH